MSSQVTAAYPRLTIPGACARVALIYRDAEEYGHTHAQILAQMLEIQKELATLTAAGARRYSATFRASIAGYERALYDRVNRDCLEFVYQDTDGKTYSTHRMSKHHRSTDFFYDSGRGSDLGKLESAHCWKATGKPFGKFEVTGTTRIPAPDYRAQVRTDSRYAIALEFCGYSTARNVVRFCGDMIGNAVSKWDAEGIAARHAQDRAQA